MVEMSLDTTPYEKSSLYTLKRAYRGIYEVR